MFGCVCVCSSTCAHLCLMHTCFVSNGLKDNTEWLHGTHKESTAGSLQQRAAHGTSCTIYSRWWTTGWCHLIANSEYSTCLSVFWRNKRDGGNSCEGRERGGSQDITQGLCLSCPTHSLHTHQSEHVNMHMNRYIGTHVQTCAKVRTHCFKRWPIKNTTLLVVQQMERGTVQKSRLTWTECLRRQWWPNPYPLPVSLLCSRGVFAARMPDSRSCQGKQRHNLCIKYTDTCL